MTGLGSGLASQWTSPVAEGTYGEAPSLSGAKFTALDSDTLELKKTTALSSGIFSGKLYGRGARRVITAWAAGGGVLMDLPAQGLQQWLYPMFGSYGQTPAALTEIATSGVYKAVHAPGDLGGHTFALQKGVPAIDGTVEPFTYVGCKISEWELTSDLNAIAKLSCTIEARNELAGSGNSDPLNVSVPSLATYSLPAGGVFTFLEGAVLTGGTVSTTSGVTSVSGGSAAGNIKSFNIKQTTPLDLERYAEGNSGFRNEPLQNAIRQLGGQYVVEWLSAEAAYDAFITDTPTAIQLTFTGPVVGSSGSNHSLLGLILPLCYYDGESPKIPGPQIVTQTIPFTTLDDDTNNVIQATYQTIDSA